jgi:uncharacterized membrane protein YhaH (DUF805 family)
MMNFFQAIEYGFANYVNFQGRSQRSAYWWWTLFAVLANMAAGLSGSDAIGAVLGLVLLVPGISMAVRRLHDTDHSGWWLLLLIVPVVGWIVLVVFYVSEGTQGDNRFGPDPLAARL